MCNVLINITYFIYIHTNSRKNTYNLTPRLSLNKKKQTRLVLFNQKQQQSVHHQTTLYLTIKLSSCLKIGAYGP